MPRGTMTRRSFLRVGATAAVGALATACAPLPATQQPAAQPAQPAQPTQGEPAPTQVPAGAPVRVQFWTQPYPSGESAKWQAIVQELADEFRTNTGVNVETQIISWDIARPAWILVAQGGAHPDAADMYWLWSFAGLGGGKYGPRPLTEFKAELWPDLEDRFYAATLKDVTWNGDIYGIPHRTDVRPMIYRTDMLAEAGVTKAPDTWEELVDAAKKATKQDGANVTQWGMEFGADNVKPQQLLHYYWGNGGEYMTPDGKTATVDTPEMRETLTWMLDAVQNQKVVNPEFMEKGHNPWDQFTAGQVAILPSVSSNQGAVLDRDFPDWEGKWAMAIPPAGPKARVAYMGAGYWGLLHGTQAPHEAAQWLQFMSSDENMQKMTEWHGNVSPNKKVMASDFWTDRPWKKVVVDALEFGHPSQHPNAAWSTIVAPDAGAILYDMFYAALVTKEPLDDVLVKAQQRMQKTMDRPVRLTTG